MADTIYFSTSQPNKAPETHMFSQFHRAPITDSDGTVYWCNEQYYQSCKALVIMKYKCPKKPDAKYSDVNCDNLVTSIMEQSRSAQKIADMAREFELEGEALEEWNEEKKNVLYYANYLKFQQNPDQRTWLLSTGDAELVEAASWDRECGIGFCASKAEANRHRWGKNLLGLALQQVREVLREELRVNPDCFQAWDSSPTRRNMSEKYRPKASS